MKVLLDTDVNLDFILQRQPFYEEAKEVFIRNEWAIAEDLEAIITRNTKDFAKSSLKVYTPAEFLQTL